MSTPPTKATDAPSHDDVDTGSWFDFYIALMGAYLTGVMGVMLILVLSQRRAFTYGATAGFAVYTIQVRQAGWRACCGQQHDIALQLYATVMYRHRTEGTPVPGGTPTIAAAYLVYGIGGAAIVYEHWLYARFRAVAARGSVRATIV
jgi:hypothetical protein